MRVLSKRTYNSDTKISLIVPCYNVEKYLPRCLESLAEQTLSDSIEVICINDGSPDNSLQILKDFQSLYPELVVIIDKENEGVWRGRMDGIDVARGEYIGFVDSDDYVEPDYCEKLYNCAMENDADIAVCGFYREDAETGKIISREMTEMRKPFVVAETPERLLELNGAPWNKIFRAELMRSVPFWDTPPRIFDDMMLHLLIFMKARKVAFCASALVHYIIRPDSIMTTIDKSKLDSTYKAMLDVRRLYCENGDVGLLDFLDAAAFLHMGVSLMFRVSYDKSADLGRVLHENCQYLDENFSGWRKSEILSYDASRKYGQPYKKIYLASKIYKVGLMRPALSVYRFMIHHMGIEVKW